MTQEEEQLLLNDLYARLPYGVNVKIYNFFRDDFQEDTLTIDNASKRIYTFGIPSIKPYLRPMSSMTEEEQNEFLDLIIPVDGGKAVVEEDKIEKYNEFIYSHHLDPHGLIEKGLAIVAPEGMYK